MLKREREGRERRNETKTITTQGFGLRRTMKEMIERMMKEKKVSEVSNRNGLQIPSSFLEGSTQMEELQQRVVAMECEKSAMAADIARLTEKIRRCL